MLGAEAGRAAQNTALEGTETKITPYVDTVSISGPGDQGSPSPSVEEMFLVFVSWDCVCVCVCVFACWEKFFSGTSLTTIGRMQHTPVFPRIPKQPRLSRPGWSGPTCLLVQVSQKVPSPQVLQLT